MKKHIPNFITSLNLFSGSVAVYFAFQGDYNIVLLLIVLAAVFDFADGLAARVLKAYSPMGKELDSLADVISFGFVPGALVFSILSSSLLPFWVSFSGFVIPVFSALRLAKFNIDERQAESFIGLPTPANALFWGGLAFSYNEFLIYKPLITIGLTILMSVLLVAEIPMFSLKFKNLKWSKNQTQFVFLFVCLVLIVLFKTNSLSIIICWYVILSVLMSILRIGK